jgi:phosphonate transport system permease protein
VAADGGHRVQALDPARAPDNLKVTGQFLGTFLPPAHSAEFLAMVARESLAHGGHRHHRPDAGAGAGGAADAAVGARAVGVGAVSGRMARGPFWLRQAVRWLLIVLRSVPELVWALVFVRVVGLGPTAGVLAIALTYGGMLGKVYGEILESGEGHATQTLLRNGASRCRPSSTGCCRKTPPS